jgi:hypothetical protein
MAASNCSVAACCEETFDESPATHAPSRAAGGVWGAWSSAWTERASAPTSTSTRMAAVTARAGHRLPWAG